MKGVDTSGSNWGGNIFIPFTKPNESLNVEREFENEIGQGIRENINLWELLISYEVKHNIHLDFNIVYRSLDSQLNENDNSLGYVGAGIRVNVDRRTWDF